MAAIGVGRSGEENLRVSSPPETIFVSPINPFSVTGQIVVLAHEGGEYRRRPNDPRMELDYTVQFT